MNALVQIPSYQLSPLATATHRLYQAFVGVRQAQPNLGLKGWSQLLNSSEGELQASRLGHEEVRPLTDLFSLLYQLAGLGEVEIRSFNRSGWASYKGHFAPPDLCLDCPGYLGLEFRSGSLRLQMNMESWYWGCAVTDYPEGKETQKSLQFFDQAGERFLKLQATSETSAVGWSRLLQRFAPTPIASKPLFDVTQPSCGLTCPKDMTSFTQEWRLMASPNQVHRLLKRHQASYLGSLQRLDKKFAREVSLDALEQLLKQVQALPSAPNKPCLEMRFFASGCLQEVVGELQAPRLHLKQMCLAYAEGCMHLDPQCLEEAWVVRKPQGEGWVTSLEIFDDQGELIVQLQEHKLTQLPENLLIRQIFATLA